MDTIIIITGLVIGGLIFAAGKDVVKVVARKLSK